MTDHTSEKNRAANPFKEGCGFCQENLEAHALGILEPAERGRMERHLQWCGPCRRELAGIRNVIGMLPLAVDQITPSRTAKSRLFERIAEETPEQPVMTFGNPWAGPVATEGSITAPEGARPQTQTGRSWLMPALVAPLAIALIILGAWANSLRNDIHALQARQEGGTAFLQADASTGELRLYSLEPSCPNCDETPATGHLGGNPDENVGILVAWNLNPNEPHQIWCEDRDGQQMMISHLDVEQTGEVVQTVNFPEAIGGYSTIYVTGPDGTEEMRVAMNEEIPVDDSTPEGAIPAGD